MGNGGSVLLYVLNLVSGVITQVNKDSSSAKRYANDSTKKVFTSNQAAVDYRRNHGKK